MIYNRPLTVTEVFPNARFPDPNEYTAKRISYLEDALRSRLGSFSLNETLRYCAHLNLYVATTDSPLISLGEQYPLVQTFFPPNAIKRIEKIHRIDRGELRSTVFHRGQILELLRWILICCPENGKYRSPLQNNRSKTAFSEALLIAGELAVYSTDDEKLRREDDAETRLHLLTIIRRMALQSVQINTLIRAFGRGHVMFFDYLPRFMPEFDTVFQQQNHLSLTQYFACLTLVMSSYYNVKVGDDSHNRHLIKLTGVAKELPDFAGVFSSYLSLEARTIEDLRNSLWDEKNDVEDFYLRPLREKPLFWLKDDVAMVLDPVVHSDKAMIGPMFMINTPFQERFGYFGQAFELYVKELMSKMYSAQKATLLSDDELVDRNSGEEICDACLIDDDKLLLFEIKAVLIPDETLFDTDFEAYPRALRAKYGKKGMVGDQLARAINRLVSRQWSLLKHDIDRIRRIYPVLISYDNLLDLQGHHWFFNSDFRSALEPDDCVGDSKILMIKDRFEIAPLTIVTIDMLENLEASSENFSFTKVLEDYFAFCDSSFRNSDDDLSLRRFIEISQYSNQMKNEGDAITKGKQRFAASIKLVLGENNG